MNIDLTKKANPSLREALANSSDDQIHCVILNLDTSKEPPVPRPDPADFPNDNAFMRELSLLTTARMYRAVKDTLEELSALGIEPLGWELGGVIAYANRDTILKALCCEGVKFGVLDWDCGFADSLYNDEANLERYLAESRNASRIPTSEPPAA